VGCSDGKVVTEEYNEGDNGGGGGGESDVINVKSASVSMISSGNNYIG
jgi:hypothetical protein